VEIYVVKVRPLGPVRGIIAALLVFVASAATSTASAILSRATHDDSAVQAAPALHAPVAQRIGDEQRTQRRVSPAADLPFVEHAPRSVADAHVSTVPTRVDRTIVALVVPRAYDATAPPLS
jgi:hypothetical protein